MSDDSQSILIEHVKLTRHIMEARTRYLAAKQRDDAAGVAFEAAKKALSDADAEWTRARAMSNNARFELWKALELEEIGETEEES